jgi:hypothetical protein
VTDEVSLETTQDKQETSMTNNTPPGEPVWEHIRARYEAGEEKVKDIAESFGIAAVTLSLKAKALGWKLRTAAKKAVGKVKAKQKKMETTRDTLHRLKELLQERVAQLEAEVSQLGKEIDAIGNERQIKSVNLVVRTLEKVLDLERKDKLKRKQQSRDFKLYDDEQRRQLAERIARLRNERGGGLPEPEAIEAGRGRTELPVAVLGETKPADAAGTDSVS